MASLLSHALPYILFVAIGAAADWFGPWADPLRVVAAGAVLIVFARRGAYAELRDRPSAMQTLTGVAAGLAIGFAWVPLAKLVPTMTDTPRTGLDPAQNLVLTAARLLGMIVVVPFAEELLVRSAIPRFIDAGAGDWRERPVGSFTWLSAAISIAFFTVTHPEWLAALVTGIVWTVLLQRTRNLRVTVISHATANAVLAGYVLVTGETRWW